MLRRQSRDVAIINRPRSLWYNLCMWFGFRGKIALPERVDEALLDAAPCSVWMSLMRKDVGFVDFMSDEFDAFRGKVDSADFMGDGVSTQVPILDTAISQVLERVAKLPRLQAPVLSFAGRLVTYVKEKCDGKASIAYKRAGVSRQVYSRIVSRDVSPVDKRTVLLFCIGLQLDGLESERLLKSAGYAFSDTVVEDCVFRYCIDNQIRNLRDVDELLRRCELRPLSIDWSRYK